MSKGKNDSSYKSWTAISGWREISSGSAWLFPPVITYSAAHPASEKEMLGAVTPFLGCLF